MAGATIGSSLDDLPSGGVVSVRIGKTGIDEDRQLGSVRLKDCSLVELRIYRRSPVRGKDEMLPTKDGHRVLSNRIELRGILEVGGISSKPSRRKLGPIVCERECGGGGLHGHPDQDSDDGTLQMGRHFLRVSKDGRERRQHVMNCVNCV